MRTTTKKHIAELADLCAINGIRKVVISPGSRNAPIIIAFEAHPEIETMLIHDERTAAYFALGLAEETQSPVAICCTSGTATLNYSPAIAEAFYRQIPLFVLTADRPPELVDQGDGQTIKQKAIYTNFIKSYFQFPLSPDNKLDELKTTKISEEAITDLISHPKGPVHINIPFDEPLYEMDEYQQLERVPVLDQKIDAFNKLEKDTINEIWATSKKKLLIIGQNPSKHLLESLRPLLELSSLAVLVENTSNINHFNKVCHCIDRTLATISEDEMKDFAPDLLISCGGAVISKRVKAYLRKFKPSHNWRIGEFLVKEDTYQSVSMHIAVKPNVMFEYLAKISDNVVSNYGNKWKQKDLIAQEEHEAFCSQNTDLNDLKAIETILDFLPENSNLHLGNSSVVRYTQLFNPIQSVTYYSNRGVSGIDGCLSTAAGIATLNSDKLNTVVLGDISFMYDSNALWNDHLTRNLRIIVINNGGGGIFKILPDSRNAENHNRFFAPTKLNLDKIAQAFEIDYVKVQDLDSLESTMKSFYHYSDSNRPKMLEINTSEIQNELVLDNYFKRLRNRS